MYIYLFYTFFIFIALVLLLFYNFAFSKDVEKYKITSLQANQIKAGDVLLIDFQNINNFIITSLFKENFMHPCIVIEEEGQLYVLDYIAKKGLLKRSLPEWLSYNKTSIFLVNHLQCSDEDRKIINDKLCQLTSFYQPKLQGPCGFTLKWKRFWWPQKEYYKIYDMKSMVCVELMIFFMMEAGIVNKNRSIESFLPRDFEHMQGFSLNKKFSFKDSRLVNSLIF